MKLVVTGASGFLGREVCLAALRRGHDVLALGGARAPTIPGVVRLIEEAGAQMPIAVCSGATRADIDLILSGIKLNATFKTIVSADDVARSKPDPACYALAVERLARMHPALRLAPGDCLAIEDTAAGIASARGAGLQTLGLLTTSPRSELHRAQRVVENLEGVSVGQLRAWYC